MKKLSYALIAMLTLVISAYFVSCKKENDSQQAMLLPAVQKIRAAAEKDWQILDKSLLELPIVLEKKLKAEFVNYETDTTVMVTCRVKFKGEKEERMLPFSQSDPGGIKHYFFTMNGGKLKILFHNSSICDFTSEGTKSALPIEQVSFNFTRIDFEP